MDTIFTKQEYLALYLVDNDVTPAYFFSVDKPTKLSEKNIKEFFPKLFIYHHPIFGDIVSKKELLSNEKLSSDDMCKILNYPENDLQCGKVNRKEDKYFQ